MKLIYIIGPYSAPTWSGIEDNIRKAEKAALSLIRAGWAVVVPHTMTAHLEIYDDFLEKGKETWYEMGLEILRRCDATYVLEGWWRSRGSQQEVDTALELGLYAFYEDDGIPDPKSIKASEH